MKRTACLLLVLLLAAAPGSARGARGAVRLHGLFGDGMILQRDLPCPVWGTAQPGEEISVSILGRTRTTTAGPDGRWSVKLDPMPAGGPHELKVNDLVVRDVLVGEVWLAAGGTNMLMPVKAALIPKTEPDDSPVPMIRFFVVPRRESETPEKDVAGAWMNNRSSEAVGDASAVAFYFARELRRRLKVPVGFIEAAVENSPGDQWMSRPALQSNPELREWTLPNAINVANYAIANPRYLDSVRRADEARKRGDPVPPVLPKPVPPIHLSILYNGMIAPLVPYGIRGAVYYQGEIEYYRAARYVHLLSALIRNWRDDWGLGEFPFGYVQLASVGPRTEEPQETALPKFRDSQFHALKVPNTGMAVTVDIGDAMGALPRNKEEVGRRLALWAEAKAYGNSDLVYSGPLYDSIKIEGSKVRVKFKNLGGGLMAGADKLVGFQICGDFRHFTWADARIEGDTVVVWSEGIQWPAAVRYAWADNPECNLYNKEGLPASPFRSDRW